MALTLDQESLIVSNIISGRNTESQLKNKAQLYYMNYADLKDNATLNTWISQHAAFSTAVAKIAKEKYVQNNNKIDGLSPSEQEAITKFYINNQSGLQSDAAADDDIVIADTPMTAAQCYRILSQGTSNETQFNKAADYYYTHLNEMDQGYPLLRAKIKNNETARQQMIDYVARNNTNESAADLSRANNLTKEQIQFIKDFTDQKKYTVDDMGRAVKIETTEDEVAQSIQDETAKIAEEFKLTLDEYVTPQEQFRLPDMGDYYIGNVDTTFLELIDKNMRNKKDALKAANYASTAPESSLGYNKKKGTYFLKCLVDTNLLNTKDGWVDANHITLNIDNMSSASDDSTEALYKLRKRVEQDKDQYELLTKDNKAAHMIDLQIAGINSPSLSRWATERNVPVKGLTIQEIKTDTLTKEDLSSNEVNSLYVYSDQATLNANGKTYFMKVRDKYHEMQILEGDPTSYEGHISFKWLVSSAGALSVDNIQQTLSTTIAQTATEKLIDYIKKANNIIYIKVDESGLSPDSSTFILGSKSIWVAEDNQALLEYMAKCSSNLTLTGYNRVTMERSRRFLGEVYIKLPGNMSDKVFVNLAKVLANDEDLTNNAVASLLTEEDEIIDETSSLADMVTYSTVYEGNNENAFDMDSYDVNKRTYADAFFETVGSLDDRSEIQKELLNIDWDTLPEYNVILGDMSFFVPPINISMSTDTQSNRQHNLRSKGSVAKTESHMRRWVQLTLYFNEDRGINGETYIVTLPNGNKTAYAMNGLRALLSMFRFTPFLPITNKVINQTFGIDAVSLRSISIQSVPSYPKLIQVQLTLQEFEWSVYAPDIYQMALTLNKQEEATVSWEKTEEELEQDKKRYEEIQKQLQEEHLKNIAQGLDDNYEQQLEKLYNDIYGTKKVSYTNWFSMLFNWKTFRYYYQRPIIRGNILKCTGWDFNSENYIAATCGSLTTFVPMSFQDPHVKFYMADEEYLQQIYQARLELLSGKKEINFNPNQLELLYAFGKVNEALKELQESDSYIRALNALNNHVDNLVESKVYAGMFNDFQDLYERASSTDNYNKGSITNDLGFGSDGIVLVNNVLHAIDDGLENVRIDNSNFFEQDMEYISYLDGNGGIVIYGIALKLKEGALDDSELKGFMDNVSNYMGVDVFNDRIKDYKPARVFASENNRLVIPLAINVKEWKWDGTAAGPQVNTAVAQQAAKYNQPYPNSAGVNSVLVGASSYVFDYYTPTTGSVFGIKGDTGAMRFLSLANDLASHYEDLQAKGGYSESTPDVNNLMNLVYNEYDVGSPLIINWNAQLSNRFADLRALSSDGDAPQYLGGSDLTATIVIQTQNEDTARKLADIPKEISRLTRKYHMVMPCVPLRVDSEFTRFLGMNEVTVENAYISTNQNYPGLFTVTMQLIAMDRTVREREAAVRRAAKNDGYNLDTKSAFRSWWDNGALLSIFDAITDSMDNETLKTFQFLTNGALVGGVLGPLAFGAGIATGIGGGLVLGALGATVWQAGTGIYNELSSTNAINEDSDFGDGSDNTRRINQYFEMKKALAENDLYPDLELPTIQEMKSIGYEFIRYNFDDERVYVDPDFYFVYPVALQSHVYRELVIHGLENNFADTKITDATGACVTVTPNFYTGYKVTESNQTAQQQQEIARKRRFAQQTLQERNSREQDELKAKNEKPEEANLDMVTMIDKMAERDSWKVCDKINCMFLEKRFKKELDSYLATQQVISANNVDTNIGTSNKENIEAATESAAETKTVDEALNASSDTATTQVITEGAHVYTRLQKSQEAANLFLKYLQETPIEDMSTVISTENSWTSKNGDNAFEDIGSAVSAFLEISPVQDFLTDLDIEITEEFKSCVAYVVKAAACNGTGKKEYSAKNTGDWKPRNSFIGQVAGIPGNNHVHAIEVSTRKISKEGSDSDLEDKITQVILCGISFGVFGINMYSTEQIHNMLIDSDDETFADENIIKIPDDYDKDRLRYTVNTHMFLLDPYYRRGDTSITTVEKYKEGCVCSVIYCTFAYMRLLMYWLYRLVKRYAIPTLSMDVFSSVVKLQQEISEKQKEYTGTGEMLLQNQDGTITSVQKYIDFFTKDVVYTHVGKLWTAAIIASSNGDRELLKRIDSRDYDALNSIVQSCSTVKTEIDVKSNIAASSIRKMVLALVGLKMITSMNAIGINQTLPNVQSARTTQQRLYLEAAQDPNKFIPHSYHDMIVNDARGRMLRAFPTFYMCFIDEGREIGFWKLHDNFYNTSSISEIQITKSRKIPADLCTIKMSNFYNSYTTEAEDYVRTQVATIDQAWDSIFSPSNYFAYMEVNRRNKPMEIKLRLRQGARIHVRMGYGNNAAMLPVLFNGVITEVTAMDEVDITAQGDGWELVNPIQIDKQAHNLSHQDEWFDSFDNADTPLQIATALFNTHGGKFATIARETLEINLGDRNPFGIVHFGNPDFKTFVKCGEACQNLYETMNRPLFGGNIDVKNEQYDNYVSDDVPQITFDMFQKTPWDVLNICKSISPDFRLGVVPFGFRSTVFMGSPHYYMCYDYAKDAEGVTQERRKPFQQWHIYTDTTDVIGNGIVATARDMHNVAMGMYTVCESLNIESQETVGPLFADRDIYPDSQRTMIVDTSLLGKGPAFVGVITNSIAQRLENNFNVFDDTGAVTNHKKVAWRSTASALRESVMDMYAGDLILFGDPSVKPQDRFYLKDSYSGITGQALVKEVHHVLSVNTGFITTISPDCIACVDDNTELIKTMFGERVGAVGSMHDACNHGIGYTIGREIAAGGVGYLTGRWLVGTSNGAKAEAALQAAQAKLGTLAKGTAEYVRQAKIVNDLKDKVQGFKAISMAASAAKGAKAFANVLGAGRALAAIGSLGGIAMSGILSGGIIPAAAAAASLLVMPFVNAFLEEELKNYKVIKIYPFKKYGYAYTAGFEGARGTVYGSPTWGDRGTLGDVFDAIQDKCPIAGAIAEFMFSDEVLNLANKYVRDNNIINTDGSAAQLETAYGNFAGHLAGDDYTYKYTDYRSQQLTPRATVDNPTQFKAAVNHYQMLDTKNYKTDPKFREMHLISQESRLKPYLDSQFFLILHEDPGMETGVFAQEDYLNIGGKEYRTKYFIRKDDNGNEVIDIPMLTQDAMNILVELVVRARNYVPSAATSDPNENAEILKNSYLTLRSALGVGDETTMASTGFTFILKGTDALSQRALKAALESLHSECTSESAQEMGLQTKIFDYYEQANHEVAIIVYPPEVQKDVQLTRDQPKTNNTDTTEEQELLEESATEQDEEAAQEQSSQSI